MGGRYYITGVQLGILRAAMLAGEQLDSVLDEIEEKQFLGNVCCETCKFNEQCPGFDPEIQPHCGGPEWKNWVSR